MEKLQTAKAEDEIKLKIIYHNQMVIQEEQVIRGLNGLNGASAAITNTSILYTKN